MKAGPSRPPSSPAVPTIESLRERVVCLLPDTATIVVCCVKRAGFDEITRRQTTQINEFFQLVCGLNQQTLNPGYTISMHVSRRCSLPPTAVAACGGHRSVRMAGLTTAFAIIERGRWDMLSAFQEITQLYDKYT